MILNKTCESRFWAKVDRRLESECWPWLGGLFAGNGYGMFTPGGRAQGPKGAHRVSWVMHFGQIPDGLFVCHRCDNPACVNPAHLFLGTHQDNMTDRGQKGRTARGFEMQMARRTSRGDEHYSRREPVRLARGERHGQSRVTVTDVQKIRNDFAKKGSSLASLAREFGISPQAIRRIVRREVWQSVP